MNIKPVLLACIGCLLLQITYSQQIGDGHVYAPEKKIYLNSGYSTMGASDHVLFYTVEFHHYEKIAGAIYADIKFNNNHCRTYCIKDSKGNTTCAENARDIQFPHYPSIKYISFEYSFIFEQYTYIGTESAGIDIESSGTPIRILLNVPLARLTNEDGTSRFSKVSELTAKLKVTQVKIKEVSYSDNVITYFNSLVAFVEAKNAAASNTNKKTTSSATNNPSKAGIKTSTTPTNSNTTTSSTTKTSTSGTSPGFGKEQYDQYTDQNKKIVEFSNSASQTITDATTAIFGTAAERKAKSEKEYAAYEANLKKQEEADERERQRVSAANKQDLASRTAEWNASDFSYREREYNSAYNTTLGDSWVKACKTGSENELRAFVAKFRSGYFTELAKLMIEAWEKGKADPDRYIKTAIMGNNWPLAKYLLNAGANPDFVDKTAYGDYYTPIRKLLEPYYGIEKALRYSEPDRDELLRKMIENGANPNALYNDEYYAGEITGYRYVIDLIIWNDYKGVNLKWLLDRNKLTKETKQIAFLNLVSHYTDSYQNMHKNEWRNACSVYNDPGNNYVCADGYYIACTLLVNAGVPLSGTFTDPGRIKEKISLLVRTQRAGVESIACLKFHQVYGGVGDIKYFKELQYALLNRASEMDKEYFYQLAAWCIIGHNDPDTKDASGKPYDLKDILQRIGQTVLKPKWAQINWFKQGKGYRSFSMLSFAYEFKPELVPFFKDSKNFSSNDYTSATTTQKEAQRNSSRVVPLYSYVKNTPADAADEFAGMTDASEILSFIATKNYGEAIKRLNPLIKKHDKNYLLYYLRGDCKSELKDYSSSLSDYDAALRINPNDTASLNGSAWSKAKLKKDLAKAEEQINKAIKISPLNYSFLDTRAFILQQQGNYEEARKQYEAALQMGGDTVGEIVERYGDVLNELGMKVEAVEQWKKAKKLGGGISDDIDNKINKPALKTDAVEKPRVTTASDESENYISVTNEHNITLRFAFEKSIGFLVFFKLQVTSNDVPYTFSPEAYAASFEIDYKGLFKANTPVYSASIKKEKFQLSMWAFEHNKKTWNSIYESFILNVPELVLFKVYTKGKDQKEEFVLSKEQATKLIHMVRSIGKL
jgi:hypothetical protein